MHQIGFLLLLFSLQLTVFGQTAPQVDSSAVADTIYQKRTVERVVYVYAAPDSYLSVGVRATMAQPFFTGATMEKKGGLLYGGEAVVQYQRSNWIYLAGIGAKRFTRKEQYSQERYFTAPGTYEKTDTISWYLVETPEGIQREYVTESHVADTLLVSSETIHFDERIQYSYLHIPLSVGRQLRHGFFCIDASLGISPGILLQHTPSAGGYAARERLQSESALLNRFTCDAQASLTFRYLLTFTSFVSAEIFCAAPLVPMYNQHAGDPLRKYEAGIRATFSYILFEGE